MRVAPCGAGAARVLRPPLPQPSRAPSGKTRFRTAATPQRPNPTELAAAARELEASRWQELAQDRPWLKEVLGGEAAEMLQRDPRLATMDRSSVEEGLARLQRACPELDAVRIAAWAPALLRQPEDASRDVWRRLQEHFQGADVTKMVSNRPALLDAARTTAMLAEWGARSRPPPCRRRQSPAPEPRTEALLPRRSRPASSHRAVCLRAGEAEGTWRPRGEGDTSPSALCPQRTGCRCGFSGRSAAGDRKSVV